MNLHIPTILAVVASVVSASVLLHAVPSQGLQEDELALKISTRGRQRKQTSDNKRMLTTTASSTPYTYYTEPFQYFSKVNFVNASLTKKYLPFEEYPLPPNTMVAVKTLSSGDSPQTPDDVTTINVNVEIWNIGGRPSMPKDGEVFWSELEEIAKIQILRRNNGPTPFTLPKIWENFTIGEVAEAVNGEYPGYWQGVQLQSLWKEKMKFDTSIFPFHSVNDFGLFIRCTALNTWAINLICPATFLLKWEVGRLRPEEAAFQVARGLFNDVPDSLQQLIDSMYLKTPEAFTAYPKGSPLHPSWPAMHSSSSIFSLWLAVVGDLTDAQYCELLRMDYAVAMARTVAGVHYPTDNIAGLNLGQRMVAAALPGYLYREYGIDQEVVRAKIRSLRFDWRTYDNSLCSVQYDQKR